MSNKIDYVILTILLLLLAGELNGFIPQSRDFGSEYQYRMYRSWKTRERVVSELPAKINHEVIERRLNFADEKVSVIYYWKNWEIYQQMESLPDWLPHTEFEDELIIAGEVLYRLNCQHTIFAKHYFDIFPIKISYSGFEGVAAIDSLSSRYEGERLPVKSMMPEIESDVMRGLSFRFENGDGFRIEYIAYSNISESRRELERFENEFPVEKLPDEFYVKPKPAIKYDFKVEEKDSIIVEKVTMDTIRLGVELEKDIKAVKKNEHVIEEVEKFIKDSQYKSMIKEPGESVETAYEEELLEWVEKHQETNWGRELLNNKIDDIKVFLEEEFPEHSILIDGHDYNLIHVPFDESLPSNLYLKINHEDNWRISVTNDVEIDKNQVVIAGFEEFDLSGLKDYEADNICGYIPQLLISHRVMNSRLSGFIFEPDMISTTLVVNGNQRNIYSINSYNDLLAMLGNFWEDRTIYYTVNDFKVVDGYIEFKGYMAAESKTDDSYDLAEIRYRLDEEYKMDLAMMVLYLEQHKILEKGR